MGGGATRRSSPLPRRSKALSIHRRRARRWRHRAWHGCRGTFASWHARQARGTSPVALLTLGSSTRQPRLRRRWFWVRVQCSSAARGAREVRGRHASVGHGPTMSPDARDPLPAVCLSATLAAGAGRGQWCWSWRLPLLYVVSVFAFLMPPRNAKLADPTTLLTLAFYPSNAPAMRCWQELKRQEAGEATFTHWVLLPLHGRARDKFCWEQ